jgi:hypothetical protein
VVRQTGNQPSRFRVRISIITGCRSDQAGYIYTEQGQAEAQNQPEQPRADAEQMPTQYRARQSQAEPDAGPGQKNSQISRQMQSQLEPNIKSEQAWEIVPDPQ